jgi:hypothetical protein
VARAFRALLQLRAPPFDDHFLRGSVRGFEGRHHVGGGLELQQRTFLQQAYIIAHRVMRASG